MKTGFTGFQRQERFPALPFYTGLNHVTGHEFKSALQVFGKLFFWPVQVSYECLQCIQFPKQVLWSPRTITANAEETVRGRYRKLFYWKLNIRNGMLWKRSGSRKVRGQGLKKTKPVSGPGWHNLLIFYHFPIVAELPWRLQINLIGDRSMGKNKWLILKQNDKQSGLPWLFEYR